MGALIRETFRAMIARAEPQFENTDFVFSQWLTLKLIDSGRISCIGDITREVGLESGASTRQVDQLEKRGLLSRRRSTGDRRIVGIGLTGQGAKVVRDMQPRLLHFWQERLAVFTAAEQEQLFSLLSRLRDELVNDTEPSSDRLCSPHDPGFEDSGSS
jgi:DNA-binding MarR family transcriptional regulator